MFLPSVHKSFCLCLLLCLTERSNALWLPQLNSKDSDGSSKLLEKFHTLWSNLVPGAGPGAEVPIRRPYAVRKMTEDEGEMFFPSYWGYEDEWPQQRQPKTEPFTNASLLLPAHAAFALHHIHNPNGHDISHFLLPRVLFPALVKRDFKCPGGTSSCAGINQPNICCPSDQTCQALSGGGVGCCAQGQSCSSEVGPCGTGYTSCPDGGGCCIPGYSCAGSIGCEAESTATVTVTPTASASAAASSSSSSSSDVSPVIVSTSTHTDTTSTTSTVTASPSSGPPPSSSASSSTPTAHGTIIPLAPVRATSGSSPSATTTVTPSICPTGFYACSAHYDGGCCRVGRDCATTSCPVVSQSTALVSNGVTIGVPAETTGLAGLGKNGCALGWYACGTANASGNGTSKGKREGPPGGCCPSGYACGGADASCTATDVNLGGGVTGTAKVIKNNDAVGMGIGRGGLVLIGMGWITLFFCLLG